MKVLLIKHHTHAGVMYPPGEVLILDTETAQWLIDQGRAEPAPTTKDTKKTTQGD